MGKNIIITLPKTTTWEDYKRELKTVESGLYNMNYKVNSFPKDTEVGDKCYVVHNGNVMGWMEITGFDEKEFDCSTTGKKWKGKFIQRSGKFNYIDENIPYKGFQGWRYF